MATYALREFRGPAYATIYPWTQTSQGLSTPGWYVERGLVVRSGYVSSRADLRSREFHSDPRMALRMHLANVRLMIQYYDDDVLPLLV